LNHTVRTGFLETVDTKIIFRVPHHVFPLAIDPAHVEASEASFMRPGDWIVGVRVNGEARCYPAWILDNHHAVNDTLGGLHVAVMHCEICCSNAAYMAEHEGRRLLFGTAGLYGGTLAVYDTETRSTWSHGMGVAFEGALKGACLPSIQSFQASWQEWLALFPETTVMAWTEPECHPDGRHGHGARDTFAHAGMYKEPVSTMIVGNDPRLPEHEMVMTFAIGSEQAALPLRELARAGGLFQMELAGAALAVISAGQASAMSGAYYRCLAARPFEELDFELRDGRVVDTRTGSEWRADGRAISGPLAGESLIPLPTMINKWHSLACFMPGIRLLAHDGPPVPVSLGEASEVVSTLRARGVATEVLHEIYSLELPDAADRGFHVLLDGDPFDLLIFEDDTTAEDYALSTRHSAQAGRLVLASSPERRFKDDLNVYPLSEDEIEWSGLLLDDGFLGIIRDASSTLKTGHAYSRPNISDLYMALSEGGFDAEIKGCCSRDAIPPGVLMGVHMEIEGDSFIIHRYKDRASVGADRAASDHCLAAGSFIIKSDADMYAIPAPMSTLRKPDEAVNWSRLLDDPQFMRLVQLICD
jgi:hypothetical protein